ncbi:hypothetical protein V2G26_012715 [Clonostachys chloroleuca]
MGVSKGVNLVEFSEASIHRWRVYEFTALDRLVIPGLGHFGRVSRTLVAINVVCDAARSEAGILRLQRLRFAQKGFGYLQGKRRRSRGYPGLLPPLKIPADSHPKPTPDQLGIFRTPKANRPSVLVLRHQISAKDPLVFHRRGSEQIKISQPSFSDDSQTRQDQILRSSERDQAHRREIDDRHPHHQTGVCHPPLGLVWSRGEPK